MPIQVPEYRNRVTKGVVRVGEEKAALPHAQNFENGARSIMQLGHAVSQEGDRWARALAHREERESAKHAADILLAFDKENSELLNGTVDEKGNTITPGLLASQLENAKGTAQTYLTKGNELMGKYLGMAKTKSEQAYLERALGRSYQNSYDRMISHELDQTRSAAAKSTKAYFDTAKGMAGAITKPQDMREHLDDLYQMSDKEGRSNGLDEEALKSARYGVANENVSASVKGAVFNGDLATADKMLKSSKDDLLPADYNALTHFVTLAKKAKTQAEKEALPNLYKWAFDMAEQNPDALQQEVQLFRANPSSYQNKISQQMGTPIEAKKLEEFFNWTQSNLLDNPDTAAGQQKKARFAEDETLYKSFGIKTDEKGKTKIQNKEFNNTDSLYSAVQTLSAHIKNGTFTKEDTKKATTYYSNLMEQLGKKVKEANYAHNLFWDASGEKMLQNEIAIFAKEAELAPSDVAEIYITARRIADLHQLDLSKDYQDDQADKVETVFTRARKEYYYKTYGVPLDQADAFVYDDKLVKLQEKNKKDRATYVKEVVGAAHKYAAEKRNGQDARVSRDKNGQVTSIYFDKGTN